MVGLGRGGERRRAVIVACQPEETGCQPGQVLVARKISPGSMSTLVRATSWRRSGRPRCRPVHTPIADGRVAVRLKGGPARPVGGNAAATQLETMVRVASLE